MRRIFALGMKREGLKTQLNSSAGSSSFGLSPSLSVSLNDHWGQVNIFSLAFHSQTTQVILKDLAVNHLLLLFKKTHKHYLLPAREPCSISLQASMPASAEPARRQVGTSGRKAVLFLFLCVLADANPIIEASGFRIKLIRISKSQLKKSRFVVNGDLDQLCLLLQHASNFSVLLLRVSVSPPSRAAARAGWMLLQSARRRGMRWVEQAWAGGK